LIIEHRKIGELNFPSISPFKAMAMSSHKIMEEKLMTASTLTQAFLNTVKNHSSNISLLSKINGEYQGIDYNELGQRVKNLALGLASLGIEKGDKVSIVAENRAEWTISDLAILSLGAVNVPIYPTLSPKHMEYILKDADSKIVIVSTAELADKIIEIFDNLPQLEHLLYMEYYSEPKAFMLYFDYLFEKGAEFEKENPGYYEKATAAIDPDDPCAIVYTSGTTGDPKGAVLSHANIFSNVKGGVETLNIRSSDRFLSFLPLCHVFERMGGQFCPLYAGGSIAYAESVEKVAQNLTEAQPTIMCSVPRLFEKMYTKILENAESGSAIKKKIFYWALRTGEKYAAAQRHAKPGNILSIKQQLAQELVYSKIQQKFGGRLRYFISGGAPLTKEIGEFFHAMGVMILEGYGLTESSPVIAVNEEGKMKFGTVGPPLSKAGVEVKIAEDGEILSRGPHIMKGYYKNPEATREVIDEDGWLHTGDIGFLDEDGYLVITDRKKNIIVTSGGKNVAPAAIENSLLTSPYIEQILIIGDKRNFLSALIFPNWELINTFCEQNNISYQSPEDLVQHEQIVQKIGDEIDRLGSSFARFEQIKAFRLIAEPLSIAAGELTPTLKIKRKIVESKYTDLIEEMYA